MMMRISRRLFNRRQVIRPLRLFQLRSIQLSSARNFYIVKDDNAVLSNPKSFRSFSSYRESYSLPHRIPNPMKDPDQAGRPGVKSSRISDPDLILSKDSKDILEGLINRIKNEVAVVIIRQIDHDYLLGACHKSIAAKSFAVHLHNLWGVGNPAQNDGVLVFLSINDRLVHFSTGGGVETKLTAEDIDIIISEMKPYLIDQQYGQALQHAILQVESALRDADTSKRLVRHGLSKKTESSDFYSSAIVISLMVFGFYFLLYLAKDSKSSDPLQKASDALDRIYGLDETSCPHCLELYSSASPSTSRVLMRCGHSYCQTCFDDIVKRNAVLGAGETQCGTCTICGERLGEA